MNTNAIESTTTDQTSLTSQADHELPADLTTPVELNQLPVNLRFEIGNLNVPLSQLNNVIAGHVFELNQALDPSSIRIVANNRLIAQGELVNVGDLVGVRITKVWTEQE